MAMTSYRESNVLPKIDGHMIGCDAPCGECHSV